MSRAAYARRFNEVVGEPPMTYLTNWRLTLAADLLREPDATVGNVAERGRLRHAIRAQRSLQACPGREPQRIPAGRRRLTGGGSRVNRRRVADRHRELRTTAESVPMVWHGVAVEGRAERSGALTSGGHAFMRRRSGKLIRVLAVAAAAALLISALPASAATAAKGEVACKVHNIGKGINRDSLQRAVWAADPGDALLVQGTCTGTTLIGKDLDISYMGWSGAPMPLGQRSTRPHREARSAAAAGARRWSSTRVWTTSASTPACESLVASSSTTSRLGGVVPSPSRQPGEPRLRRRAPPPGLRRLRSCYVANDESTAQFRRSQAAARAAAPGDHLSLRGICVGETVIGKDLHVSGWRIAISSQVTRWRQGLEG